MYATNVTWLQPEAYISIKRNRLKLYDNRNYYLKNQTNFEIELFNPTSNAVLAKIWLNDELISPAGIIIEANSREYLERFIDSPKKFQFNVFEVDDVKETRSARARNGMVKIAFFDKKHIVSLPSISVPRTGAYPYPDTYNQPVLWYGGSVTYGKHPSTLTLYGDGLISTGTSTSTSINSDALNYTNGNATSTSINSDALNYTNGNASSKMLLNDGVTQIETGRIKEGSKSNQEFITISNETFNDYSYRQYEYQILPESLKAVKPRETRQYCPKCGTRIRKSSWTFCPNCGEEL